MSKKIYIVNNTRQNISLVHSALVAYAKTGELRPELTGIFDLERIETEKEIRVIVDFAHDPDTIITLGIAEEAASGE